MPNQIIISMQRNYPFGQCQMPQRQNNEILIRKQINTGNKNQHISNAKHLKKLKVPHSVQIISIFQDLQSLQIYYEYVPVKFQIWMKNMSDFLSENLLKQLYILTSFLAQSKIVTNFKPEQLGLDKNYHIKYFLDIENTFYNEFQNASSLKQKYYRQINLFIKSINSLNNNQIKNPLFYSLNQMRTQLLQTNNASLKSFPRTLQRANSLGAFQLDYQSDINLTESTDNQINQFSNNSKQLALKKSPNKVNFNQKLKNIKEKLQLVKENGSKTIFSLNQFEKRSIKKDGCIKKASILKKPVQQIKYNIRGISIDKLINQKDKNIEYLQRKSVKQPQVEKQHSDANSSFAKIDEKKNKSQRFKTPKNSQSPVEYLDIVKSSSQYVQDFLNVLQDSSQSDDNSFEQDKFERKEESGSQRGRKGLLKTQESQNQNQNQDNKWRVRFDAAIENSKKLIDRMKSPLKPVESIVKK